MQIFYFKVYALFFGIIFDFSIDFLAQYFDFFSACYEVWLLFSNTDFCFKTLTSVLKQGTLKVA